MYKKSVMHVQSSCFANLNLSGSFLPFSLLPLSSFLNLGPTVIMAQLFEGRLALNPGLNLTRVSLSCVQKHFLGLFFFVIFRAFNHQLVDKKN